jgi:hypothetical protein
MTTYRRTLHANVKLNYILLMDYKLNYGVYLNTT